MDTYSAKVYIFCLSVISFGYTSLGCGENGLLMKDPSSPCKYLQCVHGKTISRKCPSGLGVQPMFVRGNRNPCIVNYDECKDKESSPVRVLSAQIKLQQLLPEQKIQLQPTNVRITRMKANNNNNNINKPNMRPPMNDMNKNNVILSNKKPPKSQDRKHLKQLYMPQLGDNSYNNQQSMMFPSPPDVNVHTNFQPIPPNPQIDYPVNNFDFNKNPNNNFDSEFQSFLEQVSNNNNGNVGYSNGQSYFNGNGGNNEFVAPKFDENQFAQTVFQHNQASSANYAPPPAMDFNIPVHTGQNNHPQSNNVQQYHIVNTDHTQFNQPPQQYIAVQQQQQTYQQPSQQYNSQPTVNQNHQQSFQSSAQYQDFSVNNNIPQQNQHQAAGVQYNVQNFQNPPVNHNVVQVPLPANALFQAQSINNAAQNAISAGYPKTNIAVSIPVDAFQNIQHSQQEQQRANLLHQLLPQPTAATGQVYQVQSQIPNAQIPSGYGNVQTGKAVTKEQKQEALAKLVPYLLRLPQQSQTSRLAQQIKIGQGQKKLLLAKILQRLIKALKSGKITRLNKNANPRLKLQQLGQILKRKQTSLRQLPQKRRRVQRGRRRRRKQFKGRGRRRNRQGIMGKMAKGQGFQISRGAGGNTERNVQRNNVASSQDQTYDYTNEVDYQTDDGATGAPNYDYSDDTSTQEPTYDYDTNTKESLDYEEEEGDNTESEDDIQYSNSGTNAPETEGSKFRHMRDGIRIPISPKEGAPTFVNNQQQQPFQTLYQNTQNQGQSYSQPQQKFVNRAGVNLAPQQQQILNRGGIIPYQTGQPTRPVNSNQPNQFSRGQPSPPQSNIAGPAVNNANGQSNTPRNIVSNNQYNNPLPPKVNVGNNQFGNTFNNRQRNTQDTTYTFNANQNPDNQFSKFDVSFDDGSQQTKITSSQFSGNNGNSNTRQKLSTLSIDQNIDVDANEDDIDPSLFDEMPLEYLQLLQEFALEYIDNIYPNEVGDGNEKNEISKVQNVQEYLPLSSPDKNNQPVTNNFVPVPAPTPSVQNPHRPTKSTDDAQKTGLEFVENISTLPPIQTSDDDVVKLNSADLKSNDLFVRKTANLISNNENNNNGLVQNSHNEINKHSAHIHNTTVQIRNPAYTVEKSGPNSPANEINFIDITAPYKLNDESRTEVANDSEDQIIKEDIAFQQALTYYSKLLHSMSDFVNDEEKESTITNIKNKQESYSYQDTTPEYDEGQYQSNYLPT